MHSLIRILEFFPRLVGVMGAWILAPLIVSMVWEVVARHFFQAPTIWAYEVGYMLAGASYMFGVAYCMRHQGHIRVDFIYDNVGPRVRALIDITGYLFLLLPGLLWLTWGLGEYAWEAYRDQEVSGESAWNPLVWPFRVTWLIGFAALCLQVVAEVLKALLVLFGHDEWIRQDPDEWKSSVGADEEAV